MSDDSQMSSLMTEARRRKVFRSAGLYVVAIWVVLQVADLAFESWGIPSRALRYVWIGALGGFPLAIVLAWKYQLTEHGIVRFGDESSEASSLGLDWRDKLVIAALVTVIVGTLLGILKETPPIESSESRDAAQSATLDLNWIESVDPASIAVLPFVNMSPDPENSFFADGISEELLNGLAKVVGLRVTARTSSFSLRDRNLDARQIGRTLNVAYILEGSVRVVGERIRITTQLIDSRSDTHLWSETFDRELKSVFAIQDEIAAAVVDELKITLLGEDPKKATKTNPEAYELYLQGRHFHIQRTVAGNKLAEALLKQALAIDSSFAPAWTELCSVYQEQAGFFDLRPIDEAYEMARHAIQQALALDPQDGRAYAKLASIKMFYDWDFAEGRQHLQRALALNPGDAFVLEIASHLNSILGRLEEAIDLSRQSIARDPVSPEGHQRLGMALYYAHRPEEAAVSLQMALSLSPGRIGGYYDLGWALLAQGDAVGALVAMETETDDGFRMSGLAVVHHALNDAGASDTALQELIEEWAAEMAYQVAEVYAFRGEIDHAFDWLEQAYDNRDGGLAYARVDPLLDNVHDDPRWTDFLDKMGLPY